MGMKPTVRVMALSSFSQLGDRLRHPYLVKKSHYCYDKQSCQMVLALNDFCSTKKVVKPTACFDCSFSVIDYTIISI